MKKLTVLLFVFFLISCRDDDIKNIFILNYSGQVSVNSMILNSTGHKINYGDVVETGADSFCDIVINKKNILRLKSSTHLVFKISETDNQLIVDKGWLAAVIRKSFTHEGKFKITTGSIVASIRGTSFCMKVENPDSTYFCVCNGSVTLAGNAKNSEEKVTAAEHIGRRFIIDKRTGFITIDRNPGKLYHNNEDIEKIAALIDERIDWTQPDIY